jgi:hypothetical protein
VSALRLHVLVERAQAALPWLPLSGQFAGAMNTLLIMHAIRHESPEARERFTGALVMFCMMTGIDHAGLACELAAAERREESASVPGG